MQNNLFDVSEKLVLITGSSRGIGFVMARGFASAGAKVVLNGVNPEILHKSAEALKEITPEVYAYAFDVTDYDRVEEVVAEIESQVGPIDVLINNAGIQRRAPINELSMEDWNRVIEVNLTSVFFLTRQVASRMAERKSGKIINITSLAAEGARPNISNYNAAKGGLKMLTQSMAAEWGKYNIQANAIGPGYFKTELTQVLADDPKFDAWVKSEVPLERWGDPEELVGTAIYLASPASNYVNGTSIYVDGGWLAAL
jgi:gluconate 5-dehydrogenase